MKVSYGTKQSALLLFTGVSLFIRRAARLRKRMKINAGDAANRPALHERGLEDD
jgi:hypothetical protein